MVNLTSGNRAWELRCHFCKYALRKVDFSNCFCVGFALQKIWNMELTAKTGGKTFSNLLPSSIRVPAICLIMRVSVVAKNHRLPSSYPFVRMYPSGFHWTDVREILYRGLTWILVEKTEILFRVKNIGHCTWRPKYVRLLPATLNLHKSALFRVKWYSIRLLG